MNVDLLRRAATLLRNPYLANWDHGVAHAVANLLASVAAEAEDVGLGTGNADLSAFDGLHRNALDTAQALLRSFGHTCGDQPDVPCSPCKLRLPEPEDAP
jgi:hypothetical protein